MTGEALAALARATAERSAIEQGLPVHVQDPGVLALVAALLRDRGRAVRAA